MVFNNPHPSLSLRYVLASIVGLGFGLFILFVSFFASGNSTLNANLNVLPVTRLQHPFTKMMKGQMVPGHPFYLMFVMRERLRLLLTQDPSLRMRLQIEYARERLEATDILLQGGEASLAITTLSKAEAYLGSASNEFTHSSTVGNRSETDLQSLIDAIELHVKYMASIKESLLDEDKSRLDGIQEYTKSMRGILEEFFHTTFVKQSSNS